MNRRAFIVTFAICAMVALPLLVWQRAERDTLERRLSELRAETGALRAAIPDADHDEERAPTLPECVERLKAFDPAVQADFDYDAELRLFLASLESATPEEMAKAWAELAGTPLASMLQGYLAKAWARRDPLAALAALGAMPDGAGRKTALAAAIAGWSETDPAGALDWVRQLESGPFHDAALKEFELERLPPGEALSLAQSISTPAARMAALGALFERWAQSDPAASIAQVERLADPMARLYAQRAIVRAAWQRAPADMLAWVETFPAGVFQASARREIIANWSRLDGHAALAWIDGLPEGAAKNDAMRTLALEWSQKDSVAVIEALAGLDSGPAREMGLAKALGEAARRDPAVVAPLVMRLPEGQARENAAAQIGESWAVSSPAAAVAWAQMLPEGQTRDSALAGVARGWMALKPEEAIDWVKGWTEGMPREQGVSAMLDGGTYRAAAPQKLAELAVTLPEGETRQIAFKVVVLEWARINTVTAAAWIRQQLPSVSRDVAAEMFVAELDLPAAGGTLRTEDEAQLTLCTDMVAMIVDPSRRFSAIEDLTAAWLKADRAAAEKWLAQTDLPAARKAKLLKTN